MTSTDQQLAALWDGLGCFCTAEPLDQRVWSAYRQLVTAQGHGIDDQSRLYQDLVAAFADHIPSDDRLETAPRSTPIDPTVYDRIVALYRALYLQLQKTH